MLNESNVPELTIVEPFRIIIVPEVGDNVAVEPLVNVPVTLKLVLAVTVAPDAVVKLKKYNVPLLVIVELLFMVMVPALGWKVPVTLKVPATVAVAVLLVIEPLTVRLP